MLGRVCMWNNYIPGNIRCSELRGTEGGDPHEVEATVLLPFDTHDCHEG